MEQQSNPRWLREQPVVTGSEPIPGPFDKSESYLLRLSKLLPDLRATLANHNPDIGTRELQRGTSLVESAFSLAVEARVRCVPHVVYPKSTMLIACISFVHAAGQHIQLQNVAKRLHMVSKCPRIVASGPDMQARAIRVKEDHGTLINALEQTHSTWKQYLDEMPDTEELSSATDELQSAITSSKVLFDRMINVSSMVQMTSSPVLLEGMSISAPNVSLSLTHAR